MSDKVVWWAVREAARRAGITRKIGPHTFRHYVPFLAMSRGGGSNSVFVRSHRQESKCATFEYAT
jgi:integrase